MRRYLAVVFLCLLPACKSTPAPSPIEQAARQAVALAAVLEAAAQEGGTEQRAVFLQFGIAAEPRPLLDDAHPERRALVQAVERWHPDRKRAALDWVQANATWTSQLHALAIESFGPDLSPLQHGPTMSNFDPEIFARRDALAPLLQTALEDPAIATIAESASRQLPPFTPDEVEKRRARLIEYLGYQGPLPPFAALYAPLLAPSHGVNAYLQDGTILMVVGPSLDPSVRSLILFHEMAHQPINRLLASAEVSAALDRSECAFASIESRFGYDHWRWYFGETLVRAISHRLEGRPSTGDDFPYQVWIDRQLEAWEASPTEPFDKVIVSLLDGLHANHCGVPSPPDDRAQSAHAP